MSKSCLYRGQVMHHRMDPVGHRFTYDVVSLMLDLDELPFLRLRMLSRNRSNLFSVHDADLGDGTDPVQWVRARLAEHGIKADGSVRVHLFPRVFGFGFTPLTTWFCHRADGGLAAIFYQVHNTFGQRHVYLVQTKGDDGTRTLTHSADKCFYVSPFIGPRATYNFAMRPPGEQFAQSIREIDPETGRTILVASHVGRRVPLTDGALLRAAVAYPLLPLKIVGGIHFEALRLWMKGAPFHRKPEPPATLVSYCPQEEFP